MPVGHIIHCPACGNSKNLEPHWKGRELVSFGCPCGRNFTGRESAGSRPEKGKAMKRDQELLEDAVSGDRVTRLLSCELTDNEQRKRGVEMGNAFDEITQIEAEAKRVAGEYKSRIEIAEQVHFKLKSAVLQRFEYRNVDCHEWRDYKKGKVYVVRDDLGAITESREMTNVERQEVLPNIIVEETVKALNETGDLNLHATLTKKSGKARRASTASA